MRAPVLPPPRNYHARKDWILPPPSALFPSTHTQSPIIHLWFKCILGSKGKSSTEERMSSGLDWKAFLCYDRFRSPREVLHRRTNIVKTAFEILWSKLPSVDCILGSWLWLIHVPCSNFGMTSSQYFFFTHSDATVYSMDFSSVFHCPIVPRYRFDLVR